jgi:hypothetical protein
VAAASESAAYVVLRGGLAVPVAPVRLLLDLERRGLRIERDGADLVVSPSAALTEQDCAAIRRWKLHLLALISYAPEVM